jgi:hypothetical protein
MATLSSLALTRFVESAAALRRSRTTRPLERRLERQFSRLFRKQGRAVVAALRPLASRFDDNALLVAEMREAMAATAYGYLVANALLAIAPEMENQILRYGGAALLAGATAVIADVGEVGISFTLENPRAVAWANMHAARQVTGINDTTRGTINRLIAAAVDNGWSWTRTQQEIESRFTEFATGGDNPRSKRVAVFEIGDSYTAGAEMGARELQAAGLVMEKSWLTVNDDLVRPDHLENQNAGWILLDEVFPNGASRPPDTPNCRCDLLIRRRRR